MDMWGDVSYPLKHQIELKMRRRAGGGGGGGGGENNSFLLLFLCERGRRREVQDFFR